MPSTRLQDLPDMKRRKGETTLQFAERKDRQAKKLNTALTNKGMHAQAAAVGYCAAKKRGGGTCQRPKGWGTNHYGVGRCKNHGGSTPNQMKNAANQSLNMLMGEEIQINPLDAILWCIRLKAGEVKWLTMQMAKVTEEKEWFEWTEYQGKQFNVWVRQRDAAMRDLTRFSKDAISLGLAERAVKLAEHYGDMIARLIQGILGDLMLNDRQRELVPSIVRRHLIAIEAGPGDALGELVEGEVVEDADNVAA